MFLNALIPYFPSSKYTLATDKLNLFLSTLSALQQITSQIRHCITPTYVKAGLNAYKPAISHVLSCLPLNAGSGHERTRRDRLRAKWSNPNSANTSSEQTFTTARNSVYVCAHPLQEAPNYSSIWNFK